MPGPPNRRRFRQSQSRDLRRSRGLEPERRNGKEANTWKVRLDRDLEARVKQLLSANPRLGNPKQPGPFLNKLLRESLDRLEIESDVPLSEEALDRLAVKVAARVRSELARDRKKR